MKLRTLAAAAVLACGAIAATPSSAAHLTFDETFTTGTISYFNGQPTIADPNFQPFSRTLTFQLTSVQEIFIGSASGPGGFVEAIRGTTSIGPAVETPELLAVGGFSPEDIGAPFNWTIAHVPISGVNLTRFSIHPEDLVQTGNPPFDFLDYAYGQFIGLSFNGRVAPSAPVDETGFLNFIASLGPFNAQEFGFVQSFDPVNGGGGQSITWNGTATLNVAASAIPEPTVWGLTIAGFGLAGAALRRRRAIAA
jgi:hypothetical protein